MADSGRRKPTADEPFHSLPLDATMLASPAQSIGQVLRFSGVVLCVAGVEWYAIDFLKGPVDAADATVGAILNVAGCTAAVLSYFF